MDSLFFVGHIGPSLLCHHVARLRPELESGHHRLLHDHQDEHLRHIRRFIHSGLGIIKMLITVKAF